LFERETRARSSADRAGGFGPSGRGFDSCRARQTLRLFIPASGCVAYRSIRMSPGIYTSRAVEPILTARTRTHGVRHPRRRRRAMSSKSDRSKGAGSGVAMSAGDASQDLQPVRFGSPESEAQVRSLLSKADT